MKQYDAIIVGGGVIGLAITYYAAKRGLSVLMLEAGDLASGTSSHCDGGVLLSDKAPGFDSDLARRSRLLMADLARTLPSSIEYEATGSLLVFAGDEEAEAATNWASGRAEFQLLARGELADYAQGLADDVTGGLFIESDADVNPIALALSLATGARRLGADMRTHTPVRRLLRDESGHVHGVQCAGEAFYAARVVLAAGVWTSGLCASVDLSLSVVPRKGQIVVTAPMQRRVVRQITLEFGYMMSKFGGTRRIDEESQRLGVALVIEPTCHGNLLIGSSRAFVGHDWTPDPEVTRLIARRATRFFPGLEGVAALRTYAGLRPYTADHLPIVGEALPGLIIATGHEGDGISLSPVTGDLVAQFLAGEIAALPPELSPLRASLTAFHA